MLAVNVVSEQVNLSTTEARLLEAYRQHDHETLAEIVGQSLADHEQQKRAAGDLTADEAEVVELYRIGKAAQAKAAAAPVGDPGRPTGAPKREAFASEQAKIERANVGIDHMVRHSMASMLLDDTFSAGIFDPESGWELWDNLYHVLYDATVSAVMFLDLDAMKAAQQAAGAGLLK